MMRAQCFLLALIVVLIPVVTATRAFSSAVQIVGAYTPIKDINAPYVQEIAKWAVSEYNLKTQKALVFQKVLEGQEQAVAGVNYKLLISVKDGSSIVNYEGVVFDNAVEKTRQFVSFTKK